MTNRPSNTRQCALQLDPANANRGTARGCRAVERSLAAYGPGRSILTDQHGTIIAGNKTFEQARALGIPIQVVRTRGEQLVVVQRDDLDLATDARAKALAVADNRTSELGLEWDSRRLQQLVEEGIDLSTFWSPEEFEALVQAGERGQGDENAMVTPRATTIQPGELFALGTHRLLCGDATSPEAVQRLLGDARPVVMATDPPYGVAYDPAWRHRVNPSQRTAVGRVANDDRADWSAAFKLFPGDVVYVWHAGLKAGLVAMALDTSGFQIRSQIIWRKQLFALSRGDYHWSHEPAWYAVRRGRHPRWYGDRRQTTVWETPNLNPMGGTRTGENAVTGHGTQKPVQLFETPIRNHTAPGDAIYEPFAGSGTALITAEKTGRACYAMELDPTYVQAAIDRWEAYAGAQATKIPATPSRGTR